MTWPFSRPDAGARISATAKWCNPAKAFGFLVPQDGSSDIYCRDSALAAVDLDTLLAGATVDCETVQGQRGPEVSTDSCRRFFHGIAPDGVFRSHIRLRSQDGRTR